MDDLCNFLKSCNMYPSEKNMNLLFDRLDRDVDGVLTYDEFVTGIQPFEVQ